MLTDGEEELDRFVNTLRSAGRLVEPVVVPRLPITAHSDPTDATSGYSPIVPSSPTAGLTRGVDSWDCTDVRCWLQNEFNLDAVSATKSSLTHTRLSLTTTRPSYSVLLQRVTTTKLAFLTRTCFSNANTPSVQSNTLHCRHLRL